MQERIAISTWSLTQKHRACYEKPTSFIEAHFIEAHFASAADSEGATRATLTLGLPLWIYASQELDARE